MYVEMKIPNSVPTTFALSVYYILHNCATSEVWDELQAIPWEETKQWLNIFFDFNNFAMTPEQRKREIQWFRYSLQNYAMN